MSASSGSLPAAVDAGDLERHIAEVYRDVANALADDLHFPLGREVAEALGYPAALLDPVPPEAVASFAGVGYHLGLAGLQPGDRVLDLGSGSGTDAFAAAAIVGPHGQVLGVDMTPEQLNKAERLVASEPVSFRHARIEHLPFDDASFDVVISNGVVNLSPDKRRVFAEAARVLRPGGRLAISDIVTRRPIAGRTTCKADLWAACIAGASQRNVYLGHIASGGLALREVRDNPPYPFSTQRARNAARKYGAHSVSLLAVKPSLAPASARR